MPARAACRPTADRSARVPYPPCLGETPARPLLDAVTPRRVAGEDAAELDEAVRRVDAKRGQDRGPLAVLDADESAAAAQRPADRGGGAGTGRVAGRDQLGGEAACVTRSERNPENSQLHAGHPTGSDASPSRPGGGVAATAIGRRCFREARRHAGVRRAPPVRPVRTASHLGAPRPEPSCCDRCSFPESRIARRVIRRRRGPGRPRTAAPRLRYATPPSSSESSDLLRSYRVVVRSNCWIHARPYLSGGRRRCSLEEGVIGHRARGPRCPPTACARARGRCRWPLYARRRAALRGVLVRERGRSGLDRDARPRPRGGSRADGRHVLPAVRSPRVRVRVTGALHVRRRVHLVAV